MTRTKLIILITALVVGFTVTAIQARAGEVQDRITQLERLWNDNCDDNVDPKGCRATTARATDRLRTLLPDVERHEGLTFLFAFSATSCAEAIQADPGLSNGVDAKTFMAECVITLYKNVIKGKGGLRGFIEAYEEAMEEPEVPKQKAEASYNF